MEDSLRQSKHSRDMMLLMNFTEVKKLGAGCSLISCTGGERLQIVVSLLNNLIQKING